MGRPAHYSIDVVARCQLLLDRLLPTVALAHRDDEIHGGPLTTTFLLSMAKRFIVSRVSEADFLRFLNAWSQWIERSGAGAALSAQPLAA